MSATDGAFAQWLSQAQIAEDRLTAEQCGLLRGAFAFRQRCGDDYYSSRLLSHFLLHSDSKLKVAQIARLVGVSRPTASHQQGISSKEAVQAAHHRMAGRPHGKLLPRYAGPIAEPHVRSAAGENTIGRAGWNQPKDSTRSAVSKIPGIMVANDHPYPSRPAAPVGTPT